LKNRPLDFFERAWHTLLMNAQDEKKPKRPRDLNALAFSIVGDATERTPAEIPTEEMSSGKDPLAVELGRRGGLKGGKARAEALTPEQRSEIARKAAQKRWEKAKKEA
jgi:hypothetical protein